MVANLRGLFPYYILRSLEEVWDHVLFVAEADVHIALVLNDFLLENVIHALPMVRQVLPLSRLLSGLGYLFLGKLRWSLLLVVDDSVLPSAEVA